MAALDALLHEGEGALRKLRAGLNDTLCRFFVATAEGSMGVPLSEGDSLLTTFSALIDCGFRLEACLGLLGSSWRSGVPSLGRCGLSGHKKAVCGPNGHQDPQALLETLDLASNGKLRYTEGESALTVQYKSWRRCNLLSLLACNCYRGTR